MAFLSKGTTYSNGDQVTPTNLNAHVDSASPVKTGVAVANTGNTTDETTCDINANGEIEVKDSGIRTAKINDAAVTTAKIADANVTLAKMASASVGNAALTPAAGSPAVSGSGTGASGTNVIEAGSIGHADLNDDIISGQGELTSAPADTDEFMVSDAGTVKRIDFSDIAKARFFPQAYGYVTWDSSATKSGDYNVTSVSDPDSTTVRVTLAVTMSDTNYIVQATHYNPNTSLGLAASVSARTTTTFDLISDNAKASGLGIFFTVYGTRA